MLFCLLLLRFLIFLLRVGLNSTSGRNIPKEAQLVTVLQEVFLRANRARSFLSRYSLAIGKVVSLSSWVAVLLEVGKILHHDPLLLRRDGSVSSLRHQKKDSLAVLIITAVLMLFMICKGAFC